MTSSTFGKRYRDPRRAAAAVVHRDWLAGLATVRVPALLSAESHALTFEHLGHRQPGPEHLDTLAATLGRLHAAAHDQHLRSARLDRRFATSGDLVIPDFVSPRRSALEQARLPRATTPVAIYKDANIRNFLITDDGMAIVDFDDLTLAPFGYDLAKLVVSAAMTFGRLDRDAIEHALATYNAHTARLDVDTTCSTESLRLYADFHHQLTARYMHRNGYRYPWPEVRPWPEPRRPR